MQNHYNLIYREDERELLPLCVEEKIAITPYSPLAAGRLARDLSETSQRGETDPIAKQKYDATAEADKKVIERVGKVAKKHGVPRAMISLAWLRLKQPVIAPIIGATKIKHLESAVDSLSVNLSLEEIAYLEEPYQPHHLVGLIPYGE